jgi:hypothetical protein
MKKTNALAPVDKPDSIQLPSEADMQIVWALYNHVLRGDPESGKIEDTSDIPIPVSGSTLHTALTVATMCFLGITQDVALKSVGWRPIALWIARRNNPALESLFQMERDIRMSHHMSKLEETVVKRALDGSDKGSTLLSMFVLKGWMPQYKDSHQEQSGNKVDVRITIDGIEASARIRGNMGGDGDNGQT